MNKRRRTANPPVTEIPSGMSVFADLLERRAATPPPLAPRARPSAATPWVADCLWSPRCRLEALEAHDRHPSPLAAARSATTPREVLERLVAYSHKYDVVQALLTRPELDGKLQERLARRSTPPRDRTFHDNRKLRGQLVRGLCDRPDLTARALSLLATAAAVTEDALLDFCAHPRVNDRLQFGLLAFWSGNTDPEATRARAVLSVVGSDAVRAASVLSARESYDPRRLTRTARDVCSRFGPARTIGVRLLEGLSADWSDGSSELADTAVFLLGRR